MKIDFQNIYFRIHINAHLIVNIVGKKQIRKNTNYNNKTTIWKPVNDVAIYGCHSFAL